MDGDASIEKIDRTNRIDKMDTTYDILYTYIYI